MIDINDDDINMNSEDEINMSSDDEINMSSDDEMLTPKSIKSSYLGRKRFNEIVNRGDDLDDDYRKMKLFKEILNIKIPKNEKYLEDILKLNRNDIPNALQYYLDG